MKVLILGSRIPWPLHDGGAIATYNLLKGLSEIGVEVTYLSLNTKKHFVDENTIQKEFSFLKSIKNCFIDTGISLVKAFLNLFSGGSYNIERFESEEFAALIRKTLKEDQYDLIHFEGLFVATYIKKIESKVPTILRQHNIEFNIWKSLASVEKSVLKKKYLQFLASRIEKFEKEIINHFDSVVCITESDKKTIADLAYKGVLDQIPAGIIADIKKEDTINNNSIYHIGSMEWMPNCEAMEWFKQNIWPSIIQEKADAEFHMGGKQMPDAYLQWQDAQFKVYKEVKNLQEFTQNKSILVVPLRSGSGIRIKTIEAMMAGKAVVSTSFGANGIPLTSAENCLIADTAEEFANAVLKLLKDTELRNRIAENGRQFALAHFSNKSVSEKWKQLYLKLSNSKTL